MERRAIRESAIGAGARGRLLDVAPTLAALAGIAAPAGWQGEDLAKPIPAGRPLFAEEDHEGNVLSAVQVGDWKLLHAISWSTLRIVVGFFWAALLAVPLGVGATTRPGGR